MRIFLTKDSLQKRPELLAQFIRAISDERIFFKSNYPDFDSWITHKVIPGIYEGHRTIVLEQRQNTIPGLLILKHTDTEKKVCTLRVGLDFENKGLGVRLFELAFDILQTDKPLLSVSDDTRPKFSRLFRHFGFSQEGSYLGLYVPFREEHSFNGLLERDEQSINSPTTTLRHPLPAPSAMLKSRLQTAL